MIIAFSGKRGVGKTTASKYLENYRFKTFSIAHKLREIAKKIFPFEDKHFSELMKENPFLPYDWTPREFLIRLGDFVRFHDENYFVKTLIFDLNKDYSIDDCRFVNEANYLRELGAKIVRINRYDSLNPYKVKLNIPSECALDKYKFDFIINDFDNGHITDLYKSIDKMLKFFRQNG